MIVFASPYASAGYGKKLCNRQPLGSRLNSAFLSCSRYWVYFVRAAVERFRRAGTPYSTRRSTLKSLSEH